MSRLSDQIQKLIDPFPGSFSELARSAGIDRSTLYKIANGKRLPTRRQLKNLLEVCHATPQQQQDITQSFHLITTDSATQERNIHLQTLFTALLLMVSRFLMALQKSMNHRYLQIPTISN